MKFYPLASTGSVIDDSYFQLKNADWIKLGFYKRMWDNNLTNPERRQIAKNIKAIRTGEFREPKAGEWYLSGAIPEAYRAPNDLTSKYHILKLVLTETITKTVVKIVD